MYNEKEYKNQFYLKNREKYAQKSKERYHLKREQIIAQRKLQREARKANPEEYKKFLEYQREYRANHKTDRKIYDTKIQNRYKNYKLSAKRREYEFLLTYEDFETIYKSNCIYCWEISQWIDRLDNAIWYTFQNSAPCCWFCNKMKWIHDQTSFLKQIEKIYLNNH